MDKDEELRIWREIGEEFERAFPAGDYHLNAKQNLALNKLLDFCFTVRTSKNPKKKEY